MAQVQGNNRQLPPLVVLAGFRATGKTVVGKKLAALLDCGFLDTDAEIENRMGLTIAESVARSGWSRFRSEEKKLLAEIADRKSRVVVATGGGAIRHHAEWRLLRKNALVVWLQADSATIRDRLQADGKTETQRPALLDGDADREIEILLAERESLYLQGSDLIIAAGEKTPEQVAAGIREKLDQYGQPPEG
jgi:shikimate kinase